MPTAFDNTELNKNLCNTCSCQAFNPQISYEVDAVNKKVKFTDASTFDAGDALKVVNCHVDDAFGKHKGGQIKVAGGSIEIELPDGDFSNICLTATVVSKSGCKADLGVYNIGTKATSGQLENVAKQ